MAAGAADLFAEAVFDTDAPAALLACEPTSLVSKLSSPSILYDLLDVLDIDGVEDALVCSAPSSVAAVDALESSGLWGNGVSCRPTSSSKDNDMDAFNFENFLLLSCMSDTFLLQAPLEPQL